MKILICAVQFKGGSLQVAISLIKEFMKFPENDYSIIVSREVNKQLDGIDFPSNFHFYNLPYPSKNRLLNLVLRRSFLKNVENKTKPDCIICTSGPLYWKPHSPLLIGYNLPHLVYQESPYFKRIPKWMKIRWYIKWSVHISRYRKEAAAIFVQTEDINERLRKALKFDRVYTVSNTYNDAYKNPQKCSDKLPERMNGEFRLLTLSAFYMHKNFEIIPKVIDELLKKSEDNIRFVVTLPEDKYNLVFGSKYNDYIDVLPAPKDPRSVGKISSYYIENILKKLKYMYDVILIDTNHIIDDINLITFDNSDEILYVITSDLMDLRNMKTMIAIYNDMNLDNYHIVLNEAISKQSLDLYTINSFLGRNIDYILSNNSYIKNINKLIMNGKIATLEKGYQKETELFTKIIDNILK